MTCSHVTPEFMYAVADGDLPGDVLAMRLWEHLMEVCPTCAEGFQEWLRTPRQHSAEEGDRLDPQPSSKAQSEKEIEAAKRELAELRRIDPSLREQRIRNATRRFRSPMLADLLLDLGRDLLHTEPDQTLHFSRLAILVAERTEASAGEGRLVLASARVGNAYRALGNLQEADRYLKEARVALRRLKVLDSLIYAELDCLEASLRKDQRRFPEAKKLLARSSLAYRVAGREVEVTKNLLSLSYVHYHAGEVEQAIEVLYEALQHAPKERNDRLELWMRHNLALYLLEAEDLQGAKRILRDSRSLYDAFPDKRTALRRQWLEGRIHRADLDFSTAEETLAATARGFCALGDAYDAALVHLDLAELHYMSGAYRKLRKLASSLTSILEDQQLHREAAAALVLVQKAILDELVTATLLKRARLYFNEARNNPALRFEDI